MFAVSAQYVVNEDGQKTAVLLPISTYEQLLDDLHDLAVVALRRDETPINLDDMLHRLGIDNDDLQHSIHASR
ncbi:MAG: hypothetical protein IAE79_15795 [Anaerolinea sp.]|nr:hypothetical protein [Anaerolinea sp.]